MSARAKLTGPDAPPLQGEPRTVFQRIAVGGNVENALLTTSEFAGTLPFAAMSGTGTIDLLTLELDLRARAALVDGPTLQQDPVFVRLAGVQVPVRISGTLAEPSVLPDLSAMGSMLTQAVRGEVNAEVDAAVEEARAEVDADVEETRDEVNQELEQERDEVQERLRDRLRGLD
jgi:AsmA protein